MGLTYSENIVKKDLEKKGYDIIRSEKAGYPDFRIFNFRSKEAFFVEVKSLPNIFTKGQHEVFPKIKEKILIAIPKNGVIIYKNYKTDKEEMISSYSEKIVLEPNIVCDSCKYKWHTTSKREYISCPNCLNKTKRGKNE